MAQSAGRVGGGNNGKTDEGRGTKKAFTYSKGARKTGRTGGTPRNVQNVGRDIRRVSDPRLA